MEIFSAKALAAAQKGYVDPVVAAQQSLANKVMPVVYHKTLDAAVNAITIDKDDAGKAFSLKKLQLSIVVPAGASPAVGANGLVYARINDLVTGYHSPVDANDNYGSMFLGWVRNVWAQLISEMSVVGNSGLTVKTNYAYSDGTTRAGNGLSSNGCTSGITSITKLYVFLAAANTLPIGTIIEIRGCTE